MLEEFALDRLGKGRLLAILDVNYKVDGSPFLQRDMHQEHSKRNHIRCIHCLVRQFNGDGFTKVVDTRDVKMGSIAV